MSDQKEIARFVVMRLRKGGLSITTKLKPSWEEKTDWKTVLQFARDAIDELLQRESRS
jgi:hypothetical protein